MDNMLVLSYYDIEWIVFNMHETPEWRHRWIAQYMKMSDEDIQGFGVDASDLWRLDRRLIQQDLRGGKLGNGELLLTLAKKVWEELIGGNYASTSTSADEDRHADAESPAAV